MTVLQRTNRFCIVSPGAARFSNTTVLRSHVSICRIAESEKGELTTALLFSFLPNSTVPTIFYWKYLMRYHSHEIQLITSYIFRLSLPRKKNRNRPTLLFPAAISQTLSHIRRVAPTHSSTR